MKRYLPHLIVLVAITAGENGNHRPPARRPNVGAGFSVTQSIPANQPIAGWQADDAARNVIRQAGFGEFFTHRTGHNIGPVLHGNGANLDNLETHDERLLLPNTCFSVVPGSFNTKEFGVRSEINMMTQPGQANVTGRIQTELVRI